MARKNAYLLPGQFLLEGDYMVSSNGIFFAVLQPDGNFVVYPGTGPSDLQGGPVWASGYHDKPAGTSFSLNMQPDGNLVMYINPGNVPVWATGTAGNNYALMQQDGEFVLYAGAPGQGGGRVWGSNVRWQATRMEVSDVVYDLGRGILSDPQVMEVYEQYYPNDTSLEQEYIFEWEVSYEESRSWSSSIGGSLGIEAEFKGGVPMVKEGRIAISASVTFQETVGVESRQVETLRGTTPVKVPPFSTVEASTVVTVATVAVPYDAQARYFFDNGAAIAGRISGVFASEAKYRVATTTRQLDNARLRLALAPSILSRTAALVMILAAALGLAPAARAQIFPPPPPVVCCNQTYALCIGASCALTAAGDQALCACTVESGYSMGPGKCADLAPAQQAGFTTLFSSFSTALYATDPFYQGSGTSANCFGSPCVTVDGENAVCLCRVPSGGETYWTEAGSCAAPPSGIVYSGASSPFDGGLEDLAQNLAKCSGTTAPTPTACSSSAAH